VHYAAAYNEEQIHKVELPKFLGGRERERERESVARARRRKESYRAGANFAANAVYARCRSSLAGERVLFPARNFRAVEMRRR